jgi:hypothetical protein
LTPEHKSKPVPLAVKVHPKVFAVAQELAANLEDSSLDYVVSESTKGAA